MINKKIELFKLDRTQWNYLPVCGGGQWDSFKNVFYKMSKTKPNQTKSMVVWICKAYVLELDHVVWSSVWFLNHTIS